MLLENWKLFKKLNEYTWTENTISKFENSMDGRLEISKKRISTSKER